DRVAAGLRPRLLFLRDDSAWHRRSAGRQAQFPDRCQARPTQHRLGATASSDPNARARPNREHAPDQGRARERESEEERRLRGLARAVQEGLSLAAGRLVEVLSDSTEAYDRGQKFAHYRRIPSLREYV